MRKLAEDNWENELAEILEKRKNPYDVIDRVIKELLQ